MTVTCYERSMYESVANEPWRSQMDATALKALQAPLKEKYRDEPDSAVITLKAQGHIGEGVFA